MREIEEETGIRGRVVRPLGTIEYRFSADGRRVHKFVHHYLLEALGGTLTIEGDPDQEAIDVAWVPLSQLGERAHVPQRAPDRAGGDARSSRTRHERRPDVRRRPPAPPARRRGAPRRLARDRRHRSPPPPVRPPVVNTPAPGRAGTAAAAPGSRDG